jgi:hypothetical protein
LADLDIVSTGFDVINAIEPKTGRAHSFTRRDRRRPPPTPKPKSEVLVTKNFWQFVSPPPQVAVNDAEVTKLIDAILKDTGDTHGKH